MFTITDSLNNNPCKGLLTSERLIAISFSQGKGKGKAQPVTKNTCCYCSADRGLTRVRHFFVCAKHAKAWGII